MTIPLLIDGAGTIVTGVLERPRAEGDAILVDDGRICAIGRIDDVHPSGTVATIDLGGATLVPGLIDPHTHPVLGDHTPRQGTTGWVTSYLNGGVTSLISAGEPHRSGRPGRRWERRPWPSRHIRASPTCDPVERRSLLVRCCWSRV